MCWRNLQFKEIFNIEDSECGKVTKDLAGLNFDLYKLDKKFVLCVDWRFSATLGGGEGRENKNKLDMNSNKEIGQNQRHRHYWDWTNTTNCGQEEIKKNSVSSWQGSNDVRVEMAGWKPCYLPDFFGLQILRREAASGDSPIRIGRRGDEDKWCCSG